jgi:hypothetical protein
MLLLVVGDILLDKHFQLFVHGAKVVVSNVAQFIKGGLVNAKRELGHFRRQDDHSQIFIYTTTLPKKITMKRIDGELPSGYNRGEVTNNDGRKET